MFDNVLLLSNGFGVMAKNEHKKVVELPGMVGDGVAPASIPEIDKLCEKYVHERDKRCALTPKEIEAKGNLIAAIHKHVKAGTLHPDSDGAVVYRYDDLRVILKPGKETLKIKSVDDDEED